MSASRPSLSGVILAGGESRRMGEDKAFLRVGGRRLIDRVLDAMDAVADEVIIVTNTPDAYDEFPARLVRDVYPGTGALGGIYTGLVIAESPRSLVVACDMPFLNVDLLRHMAGQDAAHDVVMPYLGEGEPPHQTHATAKARDLHPLHAIYSTRCLAPIERAIERGDLRTIAFLPDVDVRFISLGEIDRFDPEHLSVFNANTPEELRRAEELCQLCSEAGR